MRLSLKSFPLVLLLLAWFPAAALADGFLSEVPDLPLMPGLVEMEQQGMVFDAAGGRIVEAFAQGSVAGKAVRGFYAKTLPQLGWQVVDKNKAWVRENERLDIQVIQESPVAIVHFIIRPL